MILYLNFGNGASLSNNVGAFSGQKASSTSLQTQSCTTNFAVPISTQKSSHRFLYQYTSVTLTFSSKLLQIGHLTSSKQYFGFTKFEFVFVFNVPN